MIKKVISMCATAALMMSLVGCGSTEKSKSDNKEEEVVKIAATEALTEQIDLLKNSDISSEGSVGISLIIDNKNTEEQFSWSALTSGVDEMDINIGINASWKDDIMDAGISIGDQTFTSVAYDTEYLYIDLSCLKDLAIVGGYDENSLDTEIGTGYSMGDILTMIKIPKTEIETFTSGIVDDSTIDSFKSGLSTEVVTEINALSEKAEYDDNDIVISNLSIDDVRPLLTAISSEVSKTGADIDPADITTEETSNAVINYRLSYSNDSLNQIHTFTVDDDDQVITITFSVNNNSNVNLNNYNSAVTIEEITNNELSFNTLVSTMFGGFSGSSYDDYEEDYDFDFEDEPEISFEESYANVLEGEFETAI